MRLKFVSSGLALLVGACAVAAPEAPASEVPFSFAAAPDAVVIRATTADGLGGGVETLTLYGDGRLNRRYERPGAKALDDRSVTLTPEQTNGLVATAVKSGLVYLDEPGLLRKIAGANKVGPTGYYSEDAKPTLLEIQLTALGDRGATAASSRVVSPEVQARRVQGVPELAGFAEIVEAMRTPFARYPTPRTP